MADDGSGWKEALLGDSKGMSAGEELVLLVLVVIGGSALIGAVFAAATWHAVLDWLVEKGVLVSSSEPLLPVPYGDGVGLDASRVAVAAAALVLVCFAALTALRRRVDARREEQLR